MENKKLVKIIKIFANWTKAKIKIHLVGKNIYPKQKEIWWASLGQNVGVEINGKNDSFERPVLVIKVFNNQFILIVPISSKLKTGKYYYKFINNNGEENVVVLSQIRSISSKRLVRKVSEMSAKEFSEIKRKIIEII